MGGHDIVVIGCSAGGVETLPKLLARFPRDTPASFFVVLHLGAGSEGFLPGIISRAAAMPASHPRHGEAIAPGRIYVAPPDRHLIFSDGKIALSHGPKENRH